MEKKEAEKQKCISELKIFYKKLRSYQNRQNRRNKGDKSEAKDRSLNALRLELQREYGRLGNIFCEQYDSAIIPYSEDSRIVFNAALGSLNMDSNAFIGLDVAINIVNTAIGKLESSSQNEPIQKEKVKLPVQLFDTMQLHPKVIEVSENLFKTGNYPQAVTEAFKTVNNHVKNITGLTLDGTPLMEKVFNEKKPILKVNELLTTSDKNEQSGFKHIFMGCQLGIRNLGAHENVKQGDPKIALEYLCLASLLLRRIDNSKFVKLNIDK